MVASLAPKTLHLYTKGVIPDINSGPVLPLDYEYSAATWIKQNTPKNTVIISDPISMQILSALADRSPLIHLSMGKPVGADGYTRLESVYNLLTSQNDSSIIFSLNQLREMGLTTEEYYRSFKSMDSMSFIILISQRTSIWLDSKMSYPVIYFNARDVNQNNLGVFLDSYMFEKSFSIADKIYLFNPLIDLVWDPSIYCNSMTELPDFGLQTISFDNQSSANFQDFNLTSLVDGKFGESAYFNGLNNYATTFQTFDLGDSFTIETWVKPDQDMPTQHIWNVIVSKGNPWEYILCYGNTLSQLHFGVRVNDTSYFVSIPFQIDHEWHHIVGTYSVKKLSIYLDGEQSKSVDIPEFSLSFTDGPVILGSLSSYLTNPSYTKFKGLINMVNIYDRSLGIDDIVTRYNCELPKYANLGYVDIPLKLPTNASLEIKLLPVKSYLYNDSVDIQISLLDLDGFTIESHNFPINFVNSSQIINLGSIGPIQSDVEYILKITAVGDNDILIDKVFGKIIW